MHDGTDEGDRLACPVCGKSETSSGKPFTSEGQVKAHVLASKGDHEGMDGSEVEARPVSEASSPAASPAGEPGEQPGTQPGPQPGTHTRPAEPGSAGAEAGSEAGGPPSGPETGDGEFAGGQLLDDPDDPPTTTDAGVDGASAADPPTVDGDPNDPEAVHKLRTTDLRDIMDAERQEGYDEGYRAALDDHNLVTDDEIGDGAVPLPCGHEVVTEDEAEDAEDVKRLGGDRVVSVACETCDGTWNVNLDADTARRVG